MWEKNRFKIQFIFKISKFFIIMIQITPPELYIAKVFWIRTSNNLYTTDYRTRETYETHFTVMNYGKSLK